MNDRSLTRNDISDCAGQLQRSPISRGRGVAVLRPATPFLRLICAIAYAVTFIFWFRDKPEMGVRK